MDRLNAHADCPSLMEITLFEAGELPPAPCAEVRAHAAHCSHCGGILSLIECARLSLLGGTPGARCARAHRAAALLLALAEKRRIARA